MKRLEYSAASKFLHWLTALIIFGVLPAGFILEDLPEGRIQNLGYDLHRSFGFVVLLLAAARLAVRKIYGVPEAYAGLTPFERRASTATHHSLYALLILTPLLGWAATSAFPVKISVFWLFDLPRSPRKARRSRKCCSKCTRFVPSRLWFCWWAILAARSCIA